MSAVLDRTKGLDAQAAADRCGVPYHIFLTRQHSKYGWPELGGKRLFWRRIPTGHGGLTQYELKEEDVNHLASLLRQSKGLNAGWIDEFT